MPEETPPKETKIGRIGSSEPIQFPASQSALTRSTAGQAEQYHELRKGAIHLEFDNELKALNTEWENAEFDFGEIEAQVSRPPKYWSGILAWAYWPILVVFAGAEIPITWLSFEYFGDTTFNALLMSALVGVVIVVLAHFIGQSAREFSHASRRFITGLWACVRMLLLLLIIVALCYGAAIFRQGYFEQLMRPQVNIADALLNDRAAGGALVALKPMLGGEGAMFLALNIGITVIVLLVSFFRHDPHPDYERLDLRRRRAKRAYLAVSRRRDNELAAEDRRFAAETRRKGFRTGEGR